MPALLAASRAAHSVRPLPRLRGRAREGARTHESCCIPPPHPSPPLPRKRGREQTECGERAERARGESRLSLRRDRTERGMLVLGIETTGDETGAAVVERLPL